MGREFESRPCHQPLPVCLARCRCGAGVMPAWCRRADVHADPLIFDPPSRRLWAGCIHQCGCAGWVRSSCAAAVACRFWSGLGSVFRRWLERRNADADEMGGQCRAWLLICHLSSRGLGERGCRNRRSGVVWCAVDGWNEEASETPEIPSALQSWSAECAECVECGLHVRVCGINESSSSHVNGT